MRGEGEENVVEEIERKRGFIAGTSKETEGRPEEDAGAERLIAHKETVGDPGH